MMMTAVGSPLRSMTYLFFGKGNKVYDINQIVLEIILHYSIDLTAYAPRQMMPIGMRSLPQGDEVARGYKPRQIGVISRGSLG